MRNKPVNMGYLLPDRIFFKKSLNRKLFSQSVEHITHYSILKLFKKLHALQVKPFTGKRFEGAGVFWQNI